MKGCKGWGGGQAFKAATPELREPDGHNNWNPLDTKQEGETNSLGVASKGVGEGAWQARLLVLCSGSDS